MRTAGWQLSILRLAVLFASIPIAFLVGLIAGSVQAFAIAMLVCLIVGIVLRATILSGR